MIRIKLTEQAVKYFENVFKKVVDVEDTARKIGYNSYSTLYSFMQGTQSIPLDRFLKLMEVLEFDGKVTLYVKADTPYKKQVNESVVAITDKELKNMLIQEIMVNGEETLKEIIRLGRKFYFSGRVV